MQLHNCPSHPTYHISHIKRCVLMSCVVLCMKSGHPTTLDKVMVKTYYSFHRVSCLKFARFFQPGAFHIHKTWCHVHISRRTIQFDIGMNEALYVVRCDAVKLFQFQSPNLAPTLALLPIFSTCSSPNPSKVLQYTYHSMQNLILHRMTPRNMVYNAI